MKTQMLDLLVTIILEVWYFFTMFCLDLLFRFDIPDDLTLPRFTLTSGPARHGSEY